MRIKVAELIFITLILNSLISISAEVDRKAARRIAVNFYAEKSKVHPNQIFIGEVLSLTQESVVVAYVFNLDNGFIIISGNDGVFPVLAYSFESFYTGSDMPLALNFWMENYKTQISSAILEDKIAVKAIQDVWLRYSMENYTSKEVLSEVEPMIHTTWHQGCFYNSCFPEEPAAPCGHLWTGCVATAMAQVMKFYNYPKNGSGSYGYNSSYGYVHADFENTQYNWTAMNYHLTDEDSTVAQLLYHCAIGIQSQFFPNGTGAFDFDAKDALVNYFNYSPDAQFYWRDSYPGDWKAMLRAELDEGRPILYGGADSQTNAGHTLVCDGYQDTSFFHFNWGWNGNYNGYYYLDSLIAGSNYFDFQHDAVVGIVPDIPEIFIYPPLNIEATVADSVVTINWLAPELPSNLEFLGYNVFRNGNILNSKIITEQFYIDQNAPSGWQKYKVSAVYIGGEKISPEYSEVFVEGNGIDDVSLPDMKIFPNPAKDCLYISSQFNKGKSLTISIYDFAGRKIYDQFVPKILTPEISIPVYGFSSGIYLVTLESNRTIYSQKFVIQRK
jgi:hypothetical protein